MHKKKRKRKWKNLFYAVGIVNKINFSQRFFEFLIHAMSCFLSLIKILYMSISNLYSQGFKTRNRDHFSAIVRVALSDDVITPEEKAFIKRLAIYLEINEDEVADIIEDPNNYPINPPSSETVRLERLYDLTRMVYADQIADDSEKALLKRMVIGLGFDSSRVDAVVEKALTLIAEGKDEDEFLAGF